MLGHGGRSIGVWSRIPKTVKRLDRYVFREMLPPFIMGVLIVVVMFQANFYMALGKNDLTRNVPTLAILKIILLETPGFLNQTLPIAVSLAASLAVSRIARESELTALRSAGIRVMRVLLPVALFGVLVGVGDYLMIDRVTPNWSRASKGLQTNVNILASVGDFITNVQLRLQSYTVNIGSVTKENRNSDALALKDILLIERPEPGQMTAIVAPEGTYRQGLWNFTNAKTFKFRSGSSSCDMIESKTFRINQKDAISYLVMAPGAPEMGIQELKQKIQDLQKLGQYTRNYEIEYYVKYSTPTMCLIFALVAPIFSIKFAKQGGFIGVLVSMVVVLLYFNAWVICTQIIGKNPSVNPAIAAWLPNILFLIAGLFGLRSLE